MGKTSIEWTDHSANPIRARDRVTGAVGHFCEKISPGCANCYASRMQTRFRMHEFKASHREKVELYLDETVLKRIDQRKKPTKYFIGNMSDLFLEGVQDAWLDRIMATIQFCSQHTFQLLTKRPGRALEYLRSRRHRRVSDRFPKNVWFGISAENQQRADELKPAFEQINCDIKFVSYEPALGPVDWSGYAFLIDQLICGFESGPGSRPGHPQWPRSARDWCQDMGVAFFFKQWGDFKPLDDVSGYPMGKMPRGAVRIDETGRDVTELPGLWDDSDAWMISGKKAENGRMLDGREWSEFPEKAVS